MPVRRALSATALGLLVLSSDVAAQSWRPVAALETRRTGRFQDADLSESSGVAASRRQPGLLWTINDSGHPPRLFATDTAGRRLGVYRVIGAENVDWEAVATGPCGATASSCVYIADTGDNRERRASVALYRVAEPDTGAARPSGTPRAEVLRLGYPDGPRDVEAMFIDRAGAVHLVSKGWDGVVRHYRVPAAAWRRGTATPAVVDTLPLETGRNAGRLITDAAIAPDGRRVAVRTYGEVFFFTLADDGRLAPDGGLACELGALDLLGEGIDWLDPSHLVLTSEGVLGTPGTVSVARCPAP